MVQRRSKVRPRDADAGEAALVVDGPDDRLQGSVPRKHLGSVISRGVGCAGCCPGHFHTLPTLHIPFITGPGTAGAQSPNARFRPTRCQGQNHNMWGSDHDADHNSLCLGGRRRKIVVGERWAAGGASGEAVWTRLGRPREGKSGFTHAACDASERGDQWGSSSVRHDRD